MKRRATSWPIALSGAVLFVVVGCSSGSGVDSLPDPVTLSAEPTAPEPTAPEPTAPEPTDGTGAPGAEPTGGTGPGAGAQIDAEYTPGELVDALTAVDEEESLAGVIVSDATIRERVNRVGTEAPSDLTVTPEECNVFADYDVVGHTLNANLAVMTFAGASSMQPDSLSLTSQGSDEVIQDQLEANRTQLAECSEFEMDIAGVVVTAAVSELTASTDADETFAVRTVVQVPGTIKETVSLTAVIGTTTINVMVGSSGDKSADLVRGEGLVDATVAALQGL